MRQASVKLLPIPARRHNKNVFESKHKVLRDIYTRISYEDKDTSPDLLIQRMFRISNLLYGNDCLNAYELAHGYTPSLLVGERVPVSTDLWKAHDEIKAKRKLKKILTSNQ